MKKKTLQTIREGLQTIREGLQTYTYMKGQEYMNWDAKSEYTYNFEIECKEIDDLIIMSANIAKNRLTLFDGTEVEGLKFKLFPLNPTGERVSHYFVSYSGNFLVKRMKEPNEV